jgi:hypothetical protein
VKSSLTQHIGARYWATHGSWLQDAQPSGHSLQVLRNLVLSLLPLSEARFRLSCRGAHQRLESTWQRIASSQGSQSTAASDTSSQKSICPLLKRLSSLWSMMQYQTLQTTGTGSCLSPLLFPFASLCISSLFSSSLEHIFHFPLVPYMWNNNNP